MKNRRDHIVNAQTAGRKGVGCEKIVSPRITGHSRNPLRYTPTMPIYEKEGRKGVVKTTPFALCGTPHIGDRYRDDQRHRKTGLKLLAFLVVGQVTKMMLAALDVSPPPSAIDPKTLPTPSPSCCLQCKHMVI